MGNSKFGGEAPSFGGSPQWGRCGEAGVCPLTSRMRCDALGEAGGEGGHGHGVDGPREVLEHQIIPDLLVEPPVGCRRSAGRGAAPGDTPPKPPSPSHCPVLGLEPLVTLVEPEDDEVHHEADEGHEDPQDEEEIPVLAHAEKLTLHQLQAPCGARGGVQRGATAPPPPYKTAPRWPKRGVRVSPRSLLRVLGQGRQLCADTSTLCSSCSPPGGTSGLGGSILGTFWGPGAAPAGAAGSACAVVEMSLQTSSLKTTLTRWMDPRGLEPAGAERGGFQPPNTPRGGANPTQPGGALGKAAAPQPSAMLWPRSISVQGKSQG